MAQNLCIGNKFNSMGLWNAEAEKVKCFSNYIIKFYIKHLINYLVLINELPSVLLLIAYF
jgi:hypothetical protein